jgi:hypothetical protein
MAAAAAVSPLLLVLAIASTLAAALIHRSGAPPFACMMALVAPVGAAACIHPLRFLIGHFVALLIYSFASRSTRDALAAAKPGSLDAACAVVVSAGDALAAAAAHAAAGTAHAARELHAGALERTSRWAAFAAKLRARAAPTPAAPAAQPAGDATAARVKAAAPATRAEAAAA